MEFFLFFIHKRPWIWLDFLMFLLDSTFLFNLEYIDIDMATNYINDIDTQ